VRATALRSGFVLAGLAVALALAGSATAQVEGEDPFPGPDEVQERLDEFADHPWVTVHKVGESVEDRPIRVAEVTDPNGTVPVEDRAVTLILTQQHGNEPAGTPAALRLLENVTAGEAIQDQLANQVLLVAPQVNPDGSEAGTRGNADGVDVNRDHVAVDTPEAEAIHEILIRWDVDVAADHHEYGGTGPGNPVPVRTYDYDLLVLQPRHGNVASPAVESAKDVMYRAMWPAAEDEGYSISEYGTVTADGEPVTRIAGGPDPGILRNHFGLHNTAGLLVESRIDQHPNPFHPAERRIQAHTVVMEATVEHVHENADRFAQVTEASAETAQVFPDPYYEEDAPAGAIADGYRVAESDEDDASEIFERHGVEPTAQDGGLARRTDHGLRGHTAALLHPDSSRQIADVSAFSPEDAGEAAEDVAPASEGEADETPLGLVPVAVALALAAGVAGRWRAL